MLSVVQSCHLTIPLSRYRCDELGLRIAYLFCGASLSSSLGYLIESSILATMDGRLGYAAWRSESRIVVGSLTSTLLQVAIFHRRRFHMRYSSAGFLFGS